MGLYRVLPEVKENLSSMFEYTVVKRDSSVQKSALIHDRDFRGCDFKPGKEFGYSTKRPRS